MEYITIRTNPCQHLELFHSSKVSEESRAIILGGGVGWWDVERVASLVTHTFYSNNSYHFNITPISIT